MQGKMEDRMKWITREHVKVDRVACPWVIRRFVDQQAEFQIGRASCRERVYVLV